jgi:fatty-acyl-CoA synthase
MSLDLRSLVLQGLRRGRLVFPATNQIQPINEAIGAGSKWFGSSGEAPAVAAILTNDIASVQLILGAIAMRSRLISLPLPGRGADPVGYASFINEALTTSATTQVIARDDAAELLESVGVPAIRHSSMNDRTRLAAGDRPDFELVQYTSGTTSRPKPILLRGVDLAANISAILERVEPCSGDVTVSWLPLSHDMGLIGMLMASLAAAQDDWTSGGELVLIEPERFLRDPASWLELVDHWRGTFTAAPDFGLRMATRRPPRGSVNLACLRQVITGGEIVRPSTLTAFDEAFTPSGLSELSLAPAYGMAELGLAATLCGPHEPWQQIHLDAESLQPVDDTTSSARRRMLEVASSGRALHGYSVTISPADHTIQIHSENVGSNGVDELSLAPGGVLRTNDFGLMAEDDHLYVIGRSDDVLVVNGRNLWAPEIEAAAGWVSGVRPGRVRASVLPTGEWVLEAERSVSAPAVTGEQDDSRLRSSLRQAIVGVCGIAPDLLILCEPGTVEITSSGKVRRTLP